jgi:hypothetical protein
MFAGLVDVFTHTNLILTASNYSFLANIQHKIRLQPIAKTILVKSHTKF